MRFKTPAPYTPRRRDILRRARAIQRTWTPQEAERRLAVPRPRYALPVVLLPASLRDLAEWEGA